MATTPTYPAATGYTAVAVRLLPATSTNIVDAFDNSAGTLAHKIDALAITTDNDAIRTATLYLHNGTAAFRLGAVAVPINAGATSAVARVNVLTSLGTAGADGVPCIWIPAGCKLQVGLDAAVANDKVLDVVGRAQDFS
jgi:hypothetical protein